MIEEKVAPLVHEGTSFGVYFLGVDTTYNMLVLIPSYRRAEENYKDSTPCTSKVGPDIDRKKAERLVTYLVWKRTTKSSSHRRLAAAIFKIKFLAIFNIKICDPTFSSNSRSTFAILQPSAVLQ